VAIVAGVHMILCVWQVQTTSRGYPWLERAAANIFFSLIREWLGQHMERGT